MLFLNAFDILSDKGKQLQLGLSQEGVICTFVLMWSLVQSNPLLLSVVCVCVSAYVCTRATVCKTEASTSLCIPGKPPLENVHVQHM